MPMMPHAGFESKVKNALSAMRKTLDTQKQQPVLAGEQSHVYDDKFLLAASVTNLTVASEWTVHSLRMLEA